MEDWILQCVWLFHIVACFDISAGLKFAADWLCAHFVALLFS